MRVRDVRPDDLPRLVDINNASTPGVTGTTPDDLRAIIDLATIALAATLPPGGDADVADGHRDDATEADTVGAFCLVLPPAVPYGSDNYRWFDARYDDFVYLDRVAAAPEHRGGGLGTALYTEVERRAEADWFLLEVNLLPRNDGSLRFHDRLGFVEVGQQTTSYGTVVSLMAKRLHPPR